MSTGKILDEASKHFRYGERVQLQNLVRQSDLNNECGTLLEPPGQNQRVHVLLDTGERISAPISCVALSPSLQRSLVAVKRMQSTKSRLSRISRGVLRVRSAARSWKDALKLYDGALCSPLSV